MERFPPHETEQAASKPAERIEDGVWRPGLLEAFSDKVAAGSTTKLIERRKDGAEHTPRLRITGDAKRAIEDREALEAALKASGSTETVDAYRGRKVAAGIQLTRLLRQLDPVADPRDMLKTQLTHGTEIVTVDKAYLERPKEELVAIKADGLVTNLKHIPIMAAAADCAPIIVFDPKTESIGLFHSGYRGTEAGIGPRGVKKLVAEYGSKPEDLIVTVGPHADGQSFEIGTDLFERFRDQKDDADAPLYTAEELNEMFSPHPTDAAKVLYDNGQAIRIQLRKAGIPEGQIEVSGMSTMRDNQVFSSERKEGFAKRDTLMIMTVLK